MILSLINQKGGVAKTTNTIHLGACLAQFGYRVLLIDFDSQMDLTHGCGIREPSYSIMDFLEGDKKFKIRQRAETLWILAGDLNLAASRIGRFKLRDALEPLKDHFDYILIDCPPHGINKHELSLPEIALCACDAFMIPLAAAEYPVKNANTFLGQVMDVVMPHNKSLKFLGFFFGKILVTGKNHRIYTEIMGKNAPGLLFDSFIRQDSMVDHAISSGLTIFQFDPNCRAADDYTALTNEFLKRTKADGKKK